MKQAKTLKDAYKPDVGGNFLCLTWFNPLIDGSSESRGQVAALSPDFGIWSPKLSFCTATEGHKDKMKVGCI